MSCGLDVCGQGAFTDVGGGLRLSFVCLAAAVCSLFRYTLYAR
jgi:hypothetical protein